MSTKITIPKTIKGVTDRLTDIDGLVTAHEWTRAAIVAASTIEGKPGPSSDEKSSELPVSINEFARWNIHGLTSKDTIRRYRKIWKSTGIAVTPGQPVVLPDSDFNEIMRELILSGVIRETGGRPRASLAEISEEVKTNPTYAKKLTKEIAQVNPESMKKALADAGEVITTSDVVAEAIKVSPGIRKAAASALSEERKREFNEKREDKQKARKAKEAASRAAEAEMGIETVEEPTPEEEFSEMGQVMSVTNEIEEVGLRLTALIPTIKAMNEDSRSMVLGFLHILANELREVMVAAGDTEQSIDAALAQILKEG